MSLARIASGLILGGFSAKGPFVLILGDLRPSLLLDPPCLDRDHTGHAELSYRGVSPCSAPVHAPGRPDAGESRSTAAACRAHRGVELTPKVEWGAGGALRTSRCTASAALCSIGYSESPYSLLSPRTAIHRVLVLSRPSFTHSRCRFLVQIARMAVEPGAKHVSRCTPNPLSRTRGPLRAVDAGLRSRRADRRAMHASPPS